MIVRVTVFDANRNNRNNIKMLLSEETDFELAGAFANANHCVKRLFKLKPEVVLMDVDVPGLNGVVGIKLLTKTFPQIQFLFQTTFNDRAVAWGAICAGASGVILKSQLKNSLTSAIKDVRTGGFPISPLIAQGILKVLKHDYAKHHELTTDYKLTSREHEILNGIVNGLSYKMIGYELAISYETVRSHMKKIYKKLQVTSLTELVAKAINQHLAI
jgi:DNA-binding NarL/FixJ family response regulator